MVQWYRLEAAEAPPGEAIAGATKTKYRACARDVGCTLRATFLPVRSDGVEGALVEAATEGVVMLGRASSARDAFPSRERSAAQIPMLRLR